MDDTMPLVTIVVPIYNAEQNLDNCLQSITRQTHSYLEILLVDDGSTDDSLHICDCWQAKDSRIKVIHQENSGPSAARNAGMKRAHGVYLQFVDSDDWIDSNMTQKLVACMMATNADVVLCPICCDGLSRVKSFDFLQTNREAQKINFLWHEILQRPYHVYFGSPCNKLYQRVPAQRCSFPVDTTQAEDYVFNLSYFLASSVFAVERDCQYHYRMGQNSSLSTSVRSFEQKSYGWEFVYCALTNALEHGAVEMSEEKRSTLLLRFFCWMLLDCSVAQMKENRQTILEWINHSCVQKATVLFLAPSPQLRLFGFLVRHKCFRLLCLLVGVNHSLEALPRLLGR